MKISLLFPPAVSMEYAIYMAIPTLAAYLRQEGIEVSQRDVNRRLCEHLLNAGRLARARDDLRSMCDRLMRDRSKSDGKPAHSLQQLEKAVILNAIADFIVDHIDEAVSVIRTKGNEDPERLEWARTIIHHASRILCAPFPLSGWQYNVYRYADKEIGDLREAIDCARLDAHVFVQPFREVIVPQLLSLGDRTFGMCLAYLDQVIPGLTLLRILREQAPGVRIVIGGPLMPYMEDALVEAGEIFSLIDFAIIGEGELPLVELLKQLDGSGDWERVPNLIYRSADGVVRKTQWGKPPDIAKLPPPYFGENSPGKYWQWEPDLPYLSTRGCYWSKCAFCSINSTYGFGARSKSIPTVVSELAELKARYGISLFSFADESMSPARMAQLSQAILDAGIEIYWFVLSRLESAHSREIFALAYRAGCRVVSWGMESGSQRVLDLMHKGVEAEAMLRVLCDSAEAGIWNHAFAIFGFPGETEADYAKTLAFLEEAGSTIHSLGATTFRVEKGSPVFDTPEQYGISLHPFKRTYIQAGYPYDENGESGDVIGYKRFARAWPFINGSPRSQLSFTLSQLLCLLAKSRGAREIIYSYQMQRAAFNARIRAIVSDPASWDVELDPLPPDFVQKTVPSAGIWVALSPRSGRVVALTDAVAREIYTAGGVRRLLVKALQDPQNPDQAVTTLGITAALQVLPFRAQRRVPAPIDDRTYMISTKESVLESRLVTSDSAE
jgi:radical SAM superfamily enzyme YgiQ (UPF0313 family)